jgi:outer membrane protein assembly complex protein YaeT
MRVRRLLYLCACAAILGPIFVVEPVAGAEADPAPETSKAVRFEGAADLPEKLLRRTVAETLAEYEARGRPKAYLDDAAFELRALYRERGFPFAEVAFADTETIVFTIAAGPRTRLEALEFTGNSTFDAARLGAFFAPPRRGFFSLRKDPYYAESRIVEGATALASFYRATGFLDVQVPPPQVRFSEDRRQAWVTVAVIEGARRLLRSVEFVGPGTGVMPEGALETVVAEFRDQPFNPRTPYQLVGRLRDLYGRHGYPEARFTVAQGDGEGEIQVTVTVEAGPQVTVTGLEIVGDEADLKSRKGFLKSRIKVHPGEVYDSRAVEASLRRLYATGLFDKVRLELAPADADADAEPDATARPLRLTVHEVPDAEYFLEPGYGSFERARLLAGLKRKNLFGAGITLSADGVAAERAVGLTVGLTSPRLFTQEIRFGLSSNFERRDFPSFTRQETALDLALTRDFTEHLAVTVGYELARSRQERVLGVAADAPIPQREVDIAALRLGVRFDNRDNVLVPRRGLQGEALVEYADQPLGTQLEFFRVQTRLAWFQPLSERFVLALAWRGAVIVPLGEDPIPIQERFFNGGENTVRSFREDRLGPVDALGNPQGGEVRNVLSAELRYQLWSSLQAAVFYDAGNVLAEYEKAFDFSDLRSGVGLGLRYMLPIGPLRVDGAWNPSPRQITLDQRESSFVLHVSVGMAF